jgi:hypothetical protein
MTANDDIRAYAVLIRTRTARGQRLELELRDLVQARAQHIQITQEARKQHETACLKLATHVQHVHELLSSREVTQMDAILRERARINLLEGAQKHAHEQCERASQDEALSLQKCDAMRHRIVINDERVSTLRAQQQVAHARQAQAAEDAEENEREEAYASAHLRRQKGTLQ